MNKVYTTKLPGAAEFAEMRMDHAGKVWEQARDKLAAKVPGVGTGAEFSALYWAEDKAREAYKKATIRAYELACRKIKYQK